MQTITLYYYIHNKLYQKYGCEVKIDRKKIYEFLGKSYHLSKTMRPIIIKEMQLLNLLREENKIRDRVIIINKPIFDPEENISKLYSSLKIF